MLALQFVRHLKKRTIAALVPEKKLVPDLTKVLSFVTMLMEDPYLRRVIHPLFFFHDVRSVKFRNTQGVALESRA